MRYLMVSYITFKVVDVQIKIVNHRKYINI